jgi:hypothetical protein
MALLWVDAHRPTSLDKLDYHKDQAKQLGRLAEAGDLPHMLFCKLRSKKIKELIKLN